MDVVYLYKHSEHDDFELRHSLRSIELYIPFVRKVWIFGDKPGFLSKDASVVQHVPHEAVSGVLGVKTPVRNFFLQMFLSSLIPNLAPEYLLFSDDFFLLKEISITQARQDRYLEDMSAMKNRGTSLFARSIWNTYDTLKRLGYHGYNFETHVPAYLTKARVMAAYIDLKNFVSEDRFFGMLGLTAVLNHAYKHEKMPLINIREEKCRCGFWTKKPIYEDIIEQSKGRLFFNFDNDAFGDAIRRFLSERYPNSSRYEKSEA